MTPDLRKRKAAKDRRLYSFCAECGPNVLVDEDGCCGTCGGCAMGTWLHENSVRLVRVAARTPKRRKR